MIIIIRKFKNNKIRLNILEMPYIFNRYKEVAINNLIDIISRIIWGKERG